VVTLHVFTVVTLVLFVANDFLVRGGCGSPTFCVLSNRCASEWNHRLAYLRSLEPSNTAPSTSSDDLLGAMGGLNLGGGSSAAVTSAAPSRTAAAASSSGGLPTLTAFEKDGLQVTFELKSRYVPHVFASFIYVSLGSWMQAPASFNVYHSYHAALHLIRCGEWVIIELVPT